MKKVAFTLPALFLTLIFLVSGVHQTQAQTTPANTTQLFPNGFLNDTYIISDHGKGSDEKHTEFDWSWGDYWGDHEIYDASVSYTYQALDTSPSPKYSYSIKAKLEITINDTYDGYYNKETKNLDFQYNEQTQTGTAIISAKFCDNGSCTDSPGSYTVQLNAENNDVNAVFSDPGFTEASGWWVWDYPSDDPSYLNLTTDMSNMIGHTSQSAIYSYGDETTLTISSTSTRDNHIKLITVDNSGDSVNGKIFINGITMTNTSSNPTSPVSCPSITVGGKRTTVDNSPSCVVMVDDVPTNGAAIDITPTNTSQSSNEMDEYDLQPNLLCGHNQGIGNIKFVFEQDYDEKTSDTIINLDQIAKDVINSGFNNIDPYKTYINKFSFYTDRSNPRVRGLDGFVHGPYNDDGADKTINGFSCGKIGRLYLDYFDGMVYQKGVPDAYVIPPLPSDTVYMNVDSSPLIQNWSVPVHESGHAFGALYDEYLQGTAVDLTKVSSNKTDHVDPAMVFSSNCTINPRFTYSSGGIKYGSSSEHGCVVYYVNHKNGKNNMLSKAYRPTTVSLMDVAQNIFDPSAYKFNTVSCGYILSAINGKNAKDNFKECNGMDVEDKGITYSFYSLPPQITNPPAFSYNTPNLGSTGVRFWNNIVASVIDAFPLLAQNFSSETNPATNTVVPGSDVTLTSSGFSADDNSVEFRLTKLASTNPDLTTALASSTDSGGSLNNPTDQNDPLWFIANGIQSSDGNSISFTIPDDMVPGTYDMRVASADSDWSGPVSVQAISANVITSTTTYTLIETTPVNKVLYTGTDKTFQLTGLSPNSSYCAILVATYPSGTTATSSEVCVNTQPSQTSPIPAVSAPPVFNISNPSTVSVPSVGQDYVNPVDVGGDAGGHSR